MNGEPKSARVVDSCEQFIAGVADTGDKLFIGVVDTGDNSDNIFPRCPWYWSYITKKPKIYRHCQRHRLKTVTCVNDTADKFSTGVVDTGDKTVLPILACLQLKMKNKKKIQSISVK